MKRLLMLILVLALLLPMPVSAQDSPQPNAQISWPLPVYVLRGQVPIIGTANLPAMAGYFLEYAVLPENTFTPDESTLWFPATLPANTPVQEDVLGVWDTTQTQDGIYALRLTVNVPGENPVQHVVGPLRVENAPPPFVTVEQPTAPPPAQSNVPEPLPPDFTNADWAPVERVAGAMAFVYVPAGCFMMGSDRNDEQPPHEVCLDSFWISKTEVTNSQYITCVNAGACEPPQQMDSDDRDSYFDDTTFANYPVLAVTWFQAQQFTMWLGGELPSEAQWEYAARGPEAWLYPWGETEPTSATANINNEVGDTSLAGAYPKGASWVGAVDMVGNVAEWTRSLYRDYPYVSDDGREMLDPSIDADRVYRGADYVSDVGDSRSSARWPAAPDTWRDYIGFRVIVRDLDNVGGEGDASPQ
ncbi:MAG: formylglycine-generating enzyme family protein [Anaerolineae bacterium]|nr:formylglycine-generating enzyme family protein [Anaerolineae bacterium]